MEVKLSHLIVIIVFFILYLPSQALSQSTQEAGNDDLHVVKNRVIAALLDGKINETHIKNLINNIQENGSWPSINYVDLSKTGFENKRHLEYLQDLSQAYRKQSSKFYKDATVKRVIHSAIDFWIDHDFIAANWFHNQVTGPRAMANMLLLLDGELTENQKAKMLHIAGRANLHAWGARPTITLLRIGGMMAKVALFTEDTKALKKAITTMEGTVEVSLNRGIQPDLSLQHRNDHVISTLAYGTVFAKILSQWASRFSGTGFEFSDKTIHLIIDYFLDGICKSMVYGKYPDPGALNRGMSRSGALSPKTAELPKELLSTTSYRQKELQSIIDIREGQQQPAQSYDKFFWHSEYHTHQRPAYFTSVRMFSDRNYSMEYPYNGESVKQHHYADGANFISRTGKEYFNIFPVFDWMKIPGTTIVQKLALPGPEEIPQRGLTNFVGGVSDGNYGATAFDFKSPLDSLKARKGWFMFDHEYVCLGSGITSNTGYPVATTLNQSLLKTEVTAHAHSGNSTKIAKGAHLLRNIDWILQDSVGYLFPAPATLHLNNKEATGSWYSISRQSDSPKEQIHKDTFKLWIDHGKDPQNEQYEYIVVPGIGKKDLNEYQKQSPIEILANSSQIQAVNNKRLQLNQMIFYEPGTVDIQKGLTVSAANAGLVMIQMKDQHIENITVADPTHKLQEMHLKVTTPFKEAGRNWKAKWHPCEQFSDIYIGLPQGINAGKSVTINNNQTDYRGVPYERVSEKNNATVEIDSTQGKHYIGEKYGGGIVFYVSDSGSHGLIAPTQDQSNGIRWNNGTSEATFTPNNNGDTNTNAKGNGVGAGNQNTTLIMARQTLYNPSGQFAAKVCSNAQDNGYGDWYLPSKAELNLMYGQKNIIGGFRKRLYWSSSEYNVGFVWGQNFYRYGGRQIVYKGSSRSVRCIRRF